MIDTIVDQLLAMCLVHAYIWQKLAFHDRWQIPAYKNINRFPEDVFLHYFYAPIHEEESFGPIWDSKLRPSDRRGTSQ